MECTTFLSSCPTTIADRPEGSSFSPSLDERGSRLRAASRLRPGLPEHLNVKGAEGNSSFCPYRQLCYQALGEWHVRRGQYQRPDVTAYDRLGIARRFYAPDRPWGKVVGMAREYDLSRRAIYDIIERVMPLFEPRLPGPVPCVKQLLPCAEAQDSVPCGVMLSPPTAETKTLSFIQQRGIDLAGRAVLKAFAVENLTHLDLLLLAQSSLRRRPWLARFLGLPGTV